MVAKKSINSLLKAVKVLQAFSLQEPELGTSEIARKVSLPRPTVYRIMSTLVQAHLLDWNIRKKKYRIGPELYMIGNLFIETTDILGAAEPVTKILNELSEEAVSVSIFERGNVVLIMKEEARYEFRFARPIGTILPAHTSSMGKAFLSDLADAEVDSLYPDDSLVPRTNKSIKTKSKLKAELLKIRESGISFDEEGSYDGVVGISSLIRDSSGDVLAAMGISVPVFRINEASRNRLATLIKMACSLVSYRLGYQDPRGPIRSLQEISSWWHRNRN